MFEPDFDLIFGCCRGQPPSQMCPHCLGAIKKQKDELHRKDAPECETPEKP